MDEDRLRGAQEVLFVCPAGCRAVAILVVRAMDAAITTLSKQRAISLIRPRPDQAAAPHAATNPNPLGSLARHPMSSISLGDIPPEHAWAVISRRLSAGGCADHCEKAKLHSMNNICDRAISVAECRSIDLKYIIVSEISATGHLNSAITALHRTQRHCLEWCFYGVRVSRALC